MHIIQVINDFATTGPSSTVQVSRFGRQRNKMSLQVDISATASVTVYGRVSSAMGWIALTTITTSSLVEIIPVKEIYIDVTANTGNVDVAVGH